MVDSEVEYWRTKYALLEEQFLKQKSRNEELEDRLLHMVEKIETEKKELANEIDALTRRLEYFTSGQKSNMKEFDAMETYEPEDPSMTDASHMDVHLFRSSDRNVILGSRGPPLPTKGYHHFPVLALEEGSIYGFSWKKGSAVKIV
uniref:WD_REPEATS_REGION domain-containing protein n=1 Tax=Haemonchus contortus TaxID=6289 RepID=A0A7I4YVL7_HAECO|nr:Protein D1014.4 [Haemonchus contortus]